MPCRFYLPQDVPGRTLPIMARRLLRKERPVPDFPRILQIQTLSGCNARCQSCPNSRTRKTLPQGRMDEDLFRRIVDEALRHPVRRISPYLMNEPLLDDRLPDLIRYISDRKQPFTVTKINTNGSLLTEEMGERLIESGLDRMHVSIHGIRRETYETSMGNLDRDVVLANVDRFVAQLHRRSTRKPRLKVTMVHTATIDGELGDIRRYWNSRGITVNIHALENRSHEAVADQVLKTRDMRLLSDCDRLMQQAYILWNGQCVLCCVDWERSTILGNLADSSLKDIWNAPAAIARRRNYLAGKVEGTLCAGCRVTDEIDYSFRPRASLLHRLLGRAPRFNPVPPPDDARDPAR